MPADPGKRIGQHIKGQLLKEKLLCDTLFGAAGQGAYEQATGRRLGAFSLCFADIGGLRVTVMAAIAAVRALPQCGKTAVFASSPDTIVAFAQRKGRCSALEQALRAALPELNAQEATVVPREGRGADQLRQCYADFRRFAGGPMGQAGAENGGEAPFAGNEPNISPVLSRALEYIAARCAEQVTLREVAANSFVSPCYISRIFKRELGIGFVDHLNNLRVDRAKQLLRATGMRVFEVAEAAGIPDAHYFAKLFRKCTGQSPSEYRMKNKP